MFYWMKTSGGPEGPGAPDGLGNMSKTDILRGIVSEKLATAAQEILAVVERTLAGYEEEATGFRQEIDRQRRQLEVLLQPEIKLERGDVEDTGSLGLLWYADDKGEDKDEQLAVQPATSSRQKREDLQDPDYQIPSRLQILELPRDDHKSFSPRVRSERRRPGRPRISDSQNHLGLRICILEDSQTDVLSKRVFKKFPVQELRCPPGLQEPDFLDLLRSSFPQLAAGKAFDIFRSDRTRRLQPLRVKTLTPEEIYRTIRSTGARNSALYIRLKNGDLDRDRGPQTSSDDLHPLERQDAAATDSQIVSPTHHQLRICVLEDSQSDVVSKNVLMKSSVQELQCPCGLQEPDFLELLRSSFPQLAAGKPFHVFKLDQSRRLQRLRVKTLTPEEIYRTIRSTGVEKKLLYIRLKTGEEEEELCLLPRDDDATDDSPSAVTVAIKHETAFTSSSPVPPVADTRADDQPGNSASQQQSTETDDDRDAVKSEAASHDDKAFSRDDDWKPQPSKAARHRGPRASGVERSKRTCRVCGVWYRVRASLIKHAWSHVDEPQRVCGVCTEHFESLEDLKTHLRNYQKTHNCSYCGKSFSTVTGLNCHTTLHTGNRPFKCDVCNKTFAHMSSLSVHRWVHVADKPHKCNICPKAFGLKAQLKAHSKVHTGRDKYHCNICDKSVSDLRSLTRHKATHSGERRYGCEVCGKRFKIPSTLKSHEKIHTVRDRLYLCHICCKTFLSNCSLTAHMRTHSNERPFVCIICNKAFISNGELKAHMRVHTGEAPYGCSKCGRFFKRKTHLNNHVRSHLGIKLFECGVCGKACSRQEHLTVHMRTHNGERPYKCSFCDKAFTQSHCLKTHMKFHQAEEKQFLDPSTS